MTDDLKLGHEGQNDCQHHEDGNHVSHQEHHVLLAIKTHLGIFPHKFKLHDLLQYVADLAAEHFHLTLPPGDVWELHHGERLLKLNETIHHTQLQSGEELTLTAHEYSVHLIVETASGNYAHDFRPRDLVQHVADLAAEHFQITLPPGSTWELRHGEQVLRLNETIREAHLRSGERLTLASREHYIHLTVQTLSGNYSHDFSPHELLQHVVDQTVSHLHITLPPGEVWELRHGEQLLNLNETIHQSHLHCGDKLKLAPHEGGGG